MTIGPHPIVRHGASGANAAALGAALHFQHGPIDLVLRAWGESAAIDTAYRAAWARFDGLLPELVAELGALRKPVDPRVVFASPVARRMQAACLVHAPRFITPMAAVAGAVADEILDVMGTAAPLERAFVNNGGDIAFHLAPGRSFTVGVVSIACGHGHPAAIDASLTLDAAMGARGLATSGWRGRSLSLGIADAVTVLARDAATADAAATMIANAVNVEHPAIERAPASTRVDDSDLGDRLVTVAVGALPPVLVDAALDAGAAHARTLLAAGVIGQARLALQGCSRVVMAERDESAEPSPRAGVTLV